MGKYLFGDFNARLGSCKANEEDVIGPHTFGLEATHQIEVPNRDLLIEFCSAVGCLVVNTFIDAGIEDKITYRSPGTEAMAAVESGGFHMLDFVLCEPGNLPSIVSLGSHRKAVL